MQDIIIYRIGKFFVLYTKENSMITNKKGLEKYLKVSLIPENIQEV